MYAAWSVTQSAKRTAKQKRSWMATLVASANETALNNGNVVDSFATLGYLSPGECAKLTHIGSYVFVPPDVSDAEKEADRVKLIDMKDAAKVAGEVAPQVAPKKQTKKQARLAQDVASFHKIGESNVWASFMNNKENK